jgi:tetratricopeptide (TPR) repeat protein
MTGLNNQRKAFSARYLMVLGAFLFLSLQARAQYAYNDRCQNAFEMILGLQFEKARHTLLEEKTQNPANLIPVYLENYIDFLTLFIGENRVQFDQLKVNRAGRIEKLEAGSQNSPYYRFCLAEVTLQWAIARLKFGDYTAAAFEIRKAHSLFTENNEKFPYFLPNKTGLGVVHIMVGIVPENYQWITNLMGVDGTLEQGLAELREVATYKGSDPLFVICKQEATFYLAVIAANLQKNKRDALTILDMMDFQAAGANADQAPLIIFARASILMKNGLNDRALKVLQKRITSPEAFPFYYLDYLEGLARLNQLDLEAASFFLRYLDNFKGMNYLKSAYQKLAWISLIQGDTVKYENYIVLLKKRGSSLVDEDKQAFNEATIGVRPSVVLLRSRLLFDGGYYQLALAELLDNPVRTFLKNRRDLVEYTYRLARIYHETGNTVKALDYYRQTIHRGSNEPYYFAAASAFQMGLIYENSGNFVKADSAYRKCLSIKTPEYKTSLNQKAKAGLNRLKKNRP